MKCEINVIREILLQTEQSPPHQTWVDLVVDGSDQARISQHVRLLNQAGYVEARNLDDDWKPVRLTWNGRDFLDLAKNTAVWNKTKRRLGTEAPNLNRLRSAMIAAVREIYS